MRWQQQYYKSPKVTRMLKLPNNTSKKPHKSHTLLLYSIQFPKDLTLRYKHLSFAVFDQNDQIIKESPVLRGSSYEVWEVKVYTPYPEIVVFWEQEAKGTGVRKREEIGRGILELNKFDKIIYSNSNTHDRNRQKVCQIKYQMVPWTRNRFHHNSHIFQDLQQQPLKVPKHSHPLPLNLDITYQRRAFYEPESKIIEQSREQGDDNKENSDNEDQRTLMRVVEEASRVLEESMRKSEDERRIFSKYLDDSTSYINQLMTHLQDNNKNVTDNEKILDISAIKEEKSQSEEDQGLGTQQKWYQRKFHKNLFKDKVKLKKKNLKNIKISEQSNKKVKLQLFQSLSPSSQTPTKMLSDLLIDSTLKPTKIALSYQDTFHKTHPLAQMHKQDNTGSNLWPVQIPLQVSGVEGPLTVCCEVEGGELVGCVGGDQGKLGRCQLFDRVGVVRGMAYFKIKEVRDNNIQTSDRLPEPEQQQEEKNAVPVVKEQKTITTPKQSLHQLKPANISRITQFHSQSSQAQLNSPVFGKSLAKSQFPCTKVPSSPTQQAQSPIKNLDGLSIQQSIPMDNFKLEDNSSVMHVMTKKDRKYTSDPYEEEKQEEGQSINCFKRSNTMKDTPFKFRQQLDNRNQQGCDSDLKVHLQDIGQKEQYPQSSRLYESQAIPLFSSNNKKINLKITNIDIRLNRPNYQGKYVKILMTGYNFPYYTETTKQLCFLNWEGKGYLFTNVVKTSILTIHLMESSSEGEKKELGCCKIHLNLMNTEHMGANQFEDYIREENENAIGKLMISFQFFQKNKGVGSLNTAQNSARKKATSLFRQIPGQNSPKQHSTKYKKTGSRLFQSEVGHKSAARSHIRIKSQQKNPSSLRNIELHEKIFDHITRSNNKKTLKVRKYVGGNIIIPKAPRFKTTQDESGVGPGAYEYESQFQRHATQYE